jgi:hypothetical protein
MELNGVEVLELAQVPQLDGGVLRRARCSPPRVLDESNDDMKSL